MNINRNNYEEFFLLYVDGELTPQQKQLVDEFVQGNPDLQQELDMLNDAVLQIDNELFFGNKASLYKSAEEGAINTINYQENFLLYVDNELNETSKDAVETFVLQHPALQDEFTLLKQTKLQPELVACPDKESLYKKEEERRPVIFMWAKRLAVAAAILFFAVMAWMLVPKTKTAGGNDGTTASTDKRNIAPTVTPAVVNPLNKSTKHNEAVNQQAPVNVEPLTADASNVAANKNVEKKNAVIKNPTPQQAPNTIVTNQENNIASNEQVTVPKQQEQIAITPKNQVGIAANHAKIDNPNMIVSAVNKETPSLTAIPAVYRELNTDDETSNKTVYIGSVEVRKDKLNNLFKKAKKLLGKKLNDDDATQSIASNSRSLR